MAQHNAGDLRAQLVAVHPLIQNITNTVVQQFTANVLLAVGASPAMLDHEADAGQFAAMANALLINFGTASNQQLLAADAAMETARQRATPWVVDPVGIGATEFRSVRIRQAVARHPTVIRGNASEIMALADMGQGGRGVDTRDDVEAALPAAVTVARKTGAVIALSGARDAIVTALPDSIRIARVAGGHAYMPQVIGTGCSLGALIAAYLATGRQAFGAEGEQDFRATLAAHIHFSLAGHKAGEQAAGPGSFAVAFLDALHSLPAKAMDQTDVELDSRPLPSSHGACHE